MKIFETTQTLLSITTLVVILLLLVDYRRSGRLSVVSKATSKNGGYVLDTSALIDGRVVHIVETGFMQGTLVLPKSVLDELQLLADGKDAYRREQARNGLEILSALKSRQTVTITVTAMKNSAGADEDVVRLSEIRQASLVTTDYALMQRAQAQGISCVNINELCSRLQPIYKIGDTLQLVIEKRGEQKSQGVGHTKDGVLCVVEGAGDMVGSIVSIKVQRLSQTHSGRMVFAKRTV